MQDSKRVIVLEHIKSDNIEQAIIILKENTKSKYNSIIKEAEYIVNNYAQTLNNACQTKPVKAKMGMSAVGWVYIAAFLGLIGMIVMVIQLI